MVCSSQASSDTSPTTFSSSTSARFIICPEPSSYPCKGSKQPCYRPRLLICTLRSYKAIYSCFTVRSFALPYDRDLNIVTNPQTRYHTPRLRIRIPLILISHREYCYATQWNAYMPYPDDRCHNHDSHPPAMFHNMIEYVFQTNLKQKRHWMLR